MSPKTRTHHPRPSNVGEPQSVRDAYDEQWAKQKNLPTLRPAQVVQDEAMTGSKGKAL
jgi:hypothetical protein